MARTFRMPRLSDESEQASDTLIGPVHEHAPTTTGDVQTTVRTIVVLAPTPRMRRTVRAPRTVSDACDHLQWARDRSRVAHIDHSVIAVALPAKIGLSGDGMMIHVCLFHGRPADQQKTLDIDPDGSAVGAGVHKSRACS